jgi:hypothetical protein
MSEVSEKLDKIIKKLEMWERRLITTTGIADSAITTPKIADSAVTSAKIGKAFGTESSVSVAGSGTSTIPAGIYLVSLGANTSVQYTPDGGTTWRTLIPAGQGGVVISNGTAVRFSNAATAAQTSYLYPLA